MGKSNLTLYRVRTYSSKTINVVAIGNELTFMGLVIISLTLYVFVSWSYSTIGNFTTKKRNFSITVGFDFELILHTCFECRN